MKKSKLIRKVIFICIIFATIFVYCFHKNQKDVKANAVSCNQLAIKQTETKTNTDNSYLANLDKEYSNDEKLLIDLTNETQLKEVLANPNIEQDIKDYIINKKNNGSTTLMLYSPFINTNNKSTLKSITKGGSKPQKHFFDYKGHKMYSATVSDLTLSTGFQTIEKGKSVKKNIKAIGKLTVTGLAIKNKYVALLTTGLDILTNFMEATTISNINNVVPSTSDYFQVMINYDDFTRWTYCRVSQTWKLGVISKRVDLLEVETRTYLANSKKLPVKTYNGHTTNLTSPSFDNPGPNTLKYCQKDPLVERINWKCSGASFVFD